MWKGDGRGFKHPKSLTVYATDSNHTHDYKHTSLDDHVASAFFCYENNINIINCNVLNKKKSIIADEVLRKSRDRVKSKQLLAARSRCCGDPDCRYTVL